MTRTPQDADARRLEAARWRISADWKVPLDRVTGSSEDEMVAAAASLRPDWLAAALLSDLGA